MTISFKKYLIMKSLQDLKIFIMTAKLGSLSATVRQFDLTPAATSVSLKRLEADIGVMLFVRSTRNLRLTHEGEIFLQHAEQAVELLEGAVSEFAHGHLAVHGTLNLSIPSDLGRNRVLPWLDEFQSLYPAIQLRLQLSDRLTNMFSQPVDIALRYGEPPSSNIIALNVAPNNSRVLCASPSYIEQHGMPNSPEDLVQHNCLCFMVGENVHDRWYFSQKGMEKNIRVSGDRISDDGDAVRRWAVAGKGIAYKSELDLYDDIQTGRLVTLCSDWQCEAAPLNLVCADRRLLNPSVRTLREFLQEKCKQG
ncbi:LysR family transcriptional regulator [Vibrio sp. S17_S38]|uniref:LysR family transcriptional regulator n=1 Tax=Vibrio sp. S17_S38 TaxID=2720229 RepID=UPI00237A29A9|nr:LysR family transcriptional regulator [Vibrio sp. S17_S38]